MVPWNNMAREIGRITYILCLRGRKNQQYLLLTEGEGKKRIQKNSNFKNPEKLQLSVIEWRWCHLLLRREKLREGQA
jgi:hypothetical protein